MIINLLLFEWLPHKMMIHLIFCVTLWITTTPNKTGLSSLFSPREIVNHQKLNPKVHCKLDFGELCKVHDKPEPSNSVKPKTHQAVAFRLTGNIQGTYNFFCLNTREILKRHKWTRMLVPDSVIK